ncbi:MAG: DMT family transporter [Burkholderiales bacterium]
MNEPSVLRAVLAMVAGAGLLTLNDAVTKHLTAQYPIGQVICLRQLAAFLFIVPYAVSVTGLHALRVVDRGGQLMRALLFVAANGLIVWSLSLLPLSQVTVVLFSSPVFVALFSARLLHERVDARQWLAIGGGLLGVILIVRPGGVAFAWAALVPVLAAFTNGFRDAFTRRLSRTETSISVLFWSGLMVMAAGFLTSPLGWQGVDVAGAAWFLAAGLLNASAHFMVIEALRLGRAAIVAPFRYSGLLWAMLVGFLVWGEAPDAWMLAGAAVVVASGLYMIRLTAPPRQN